MGWFSSDGKGKPKGADAEVLRLAMLYLLVDLAEEMPRVEAQRIRELVDRLQHYPMPTGLQREMERMVTVIRTSAIGTGSADFADAATALVDAMQRVSILDKELTQKIAQLKDSVPLRVRPGDARLIEVGAASIEQAADGARYRMRESQDAVFALLDAVGVHIRDANLGTDRMDGQLGQVANQLAKARDAEALFSLRQELNDLMSALRDTSGTVRADLGRARLRVADLEATIHKQHEELLEARVEMTLDGLTNVANRSAFDQALVSALVQSRRSNGLLTLMILDLDHFKQVNDTYGHPSGDDVLRTVSKVLVDTLRQDDFTARIGGEEFACLLPNSGKREAAGVAARIGDVVRGLQFAHKEEHFSVTISIGIASWDRTEPAESLYERADQAMYKAKRDGRDRYVMA